MHSMSPMTTALLHETNVHDDIKCSKLIITLPDDKKAFANLTVYFKNEPPKQAYCGQEEVGCGHINALYDDLTLQVYFLNTDKVICVYRCPTAPMKGFAGAGALVPMATQNLPEVLAQVQSCKESLAAVGVSGNLVDVEKCSD
ncbi:uncharacterized protein LOC124354931 [Homalodisca vitripennis]|uniref:uncharacterized protein LOC124354931 n=1 Tax=Homalodisca vitripennis TaxID=197043 RepID=UPI001EEBB2BE|nr:uncharacterized protein LOC124354931 [Homalodisca vitripennis]